MQANVNGSLTADYSLRKAVIIHTNQSFTRIIWDLEGGIELGAIDQAAAVVNEYIVLSCGHRTLTRSQDFVLQPAGRRRHGQPCCLHQQHRTTTGGT